MDLILEIQNIVTMLPYFSFDYSFGIVLWEICTRDLPFAHYSFSYQVENAVLAGERPLIPADTTDAYSNLLESCWDEDTKRRPHFTAIVISLETLYNSMFVECEGTSERGVAESTC